MTYNTPVRHLQQGSVLEVAASGTALISSGGSIQVASGGIINVASGGSIVNGGANSFSGVQTVASGGTLLVASGGSVQVAAGGQINNAGTIAGAGLTEVQSGGTLLVSSGGSVQVPSGGVIRAAAATGLSAPAGMLMNGTVGKWAFGTATLTSGVGTLGIVGFTRVMSVNANVILGEASGLGSPTSVHTDYTLSGAGSIILRAVAGTIGYGANVNVGYQAFGT